MVTNTEPIHVQQLSNGYWHIKGIGPCNWSTVKRWPCCEDTIRDGAGGEASDEFIVAAAQIAIELTQARKGGG